MTDYSQFGEQAIITDFFRGRKGRALDLGAFDGVIGSNTRALAEDGWDVYYVEANPDAFTRLLTNARGREHNCICAAVETHHGFAWLSDTTVDGDRNYHQQCSNIVDNGAMRSWTVSIYGVGCVTPQDIASAFGTPFDFVSIDIEGADIPVIEQAGVLLRGAKLLCVEATMPGHPWSDEYHKRMMAACAVHGFTKVVGTTYRTDGLIGNILLTNA